MGGVHCQLQFFILKGYLAQQHCMYGTLPFIVYDGMLCAQKTVSSIFSVALVSFVVPQKNNLHHCTP